MATLLITGGTGSFGSTVLKRFAGGSEYDRIIVFSRDESKQHKLMQEFPPPKVRYIIGDVRNYDSVRYAMEGVDVVFHAAALKHVPAGEFFPMEFVQTNVQGSHNVFRAARDAGAKKVVLLSTDKAVYPVNAMGMTKALAEKLVTAYASEKSNTVYTAVRYGNVMASRGSVIPLFVEQIKKGRDITITNPHMTRFMLSLDDAADLVELAVKEGSQGNLFVLKAPAATVQTIADALVEIFKAKTKTRVVGTRRGEKVHETLASGVELVVSDDLGKFYRIHTRLDMEYDQYFTKGEIKPVPHDYSSDRTERLSKDALIDVLMRLPYIERQLKATSWQEPEA